MGTKADYEELTRGLGLEDDCPVCGASWPMCQGKCGRHASWMADGYSFVYDGPYHQDFNDDCEECQQEARYPEGSVTSSEEKSNGS